MCLLLWVVGACSGQPPVLIHAHSPFLGSYSPLPFPGRQPAGKLVIADTGFPTTANPLFSVSRFDLEVASILWAAPVVFDQSFHAQPDQLIEVPLPENGDVQDGGKTIFMHLRHDLRWSDGQPILASDFAYWWHLNQDADTGAATTAGYDQIAEIATPDPFTVILHMKRPFGPYLSYLPYAAPEHAWKQFRPIDLQNRAEVFQAPTVTDGPYRLTGFVPGQSYDFVANTAYRSTAFRGPFLAQLVYQAYATLAALGEALQTGRVDVVEGYSENALSTLAALPADRQVQITPAAAYEHLDFNLAHPFFQDLRVRQAIQLAIDRCGLLRDILHTSTCSRLADQVEPPPSLFYDAHISPPAYDPRGARQLLASAGWQPDAAGLLYKHKQAFVVRLVTSTGDPLRAAVATRLQQGLRALGIQVQLAFYPLETLFADYTRGGILATGAYDLAIFGYANGPDPDDEYAVFSSTQIPDASHPDLGNYGHIADAVLDQALTQGRYSVPFATRQQAYQRFLQRLASDVYLVPLYTAVNVLVVNSRLKNVVGNPDTAENNWNVADWWLTSP